MRLTRIEAGNFGDCKRLRNGVSELRIDWGAGYRVYYRMIDQTAVLLLAGGDKRKQEADIERAIGYFQDFKRRQK
jgi:putative addiction module killer protein